MESARFAADFIVAAEAEARTPGILSAEAAFDHRLSGYADHIRDEWGSHFTLGNIFAGLIGKPAIMKLALRTGMPLPVLMKFVVRMLANLTDRSNKGLEDRVIAVLEALVPAASNQVQQARPLSNPLRRKVSLKP